MTFKNAKIGINEEKNSDPTPNVWPTSQTSSTDLSARRRYKWADNQSDECELDQVERHAERGRGNVDVLACKIIVLYIKTSLEGFQIHFLASVESKLVLINISEWCDC